MRLIVILSVLLLSTVLLSACTSTETRRSTGTVVDDATTVTRIKTALLKSPATDGLDIEVRVYRGRVQLNGFADTAAEISAASDLVRPIRGVSNLTNNIQVTADGRRAGEYLDDKVLLTRVSGALAKDRKVHTNEVDVEVNRGIVLLGGFVHNQAERTAASAAANRVPGIQEVRNYIELR